MRLYEIIMSTGVGAFPDINIYNIRFIESTGHFMFNYLEPQVLYKIPEVREVISSIKELKDNLDTANSTCHDFINNKKLLCNITSKFNMANYK